MQSKDDDELIYDLGYVTRLLMSPEVSQQIVSADADVTEVVVLDDTGPALSDYIADRNRRIDQALESLHKIFGD